jgi:5-(carboxyamino)imidazole ribonucleotide mutase
LISFLHTELLRNYSISVKCTHGISVIIAGAGAAHLPGMVASMSPLPVIGVPVKSSNDRWLGQYLIDPTNAWRSSVATVALNGSKNGILAAQIIGSHDKDILKKVIQYKLGLKICNCASESLLKQ